MKNNKIKKALSITADILIYVFLVISLLFAVFSVSSKKDPNGVVKIFDYQIRTVLTNSMENNETEINSDYKIKSIPVNSLILIENVPEELEDREEWYSNLQKGDVLTFNYVYGNQMVITHRITEITKKSTGGYLIRLKGDNAISRSVPLEQIIDTSKEDSPNFIIGKVTGKSLFLGNLVMQLKNPLTMVLAIIAPCLIIIFYQAVKLWVMKLQEDIELKNKEIDELKKLLKEQEKSLA